MQWILGTAIFPKCTWETQPHWLSPKSLRGTTTNNSIVDILHQSSYGPTTQIVQDHRNIIKANGNKSKGLTRKHWQRVENKERIISELGGKMDGIKPTSQILEESAVCGIRRQHITFSIHVKNRIFFAEVGGSTCLGKLTFTQRPHQLSHQFSPQNPPPDTWFCFFFFFFFAQASKSSPTCLKSEFHSFWSCRDPIWGKPIHSMAVCRFDPIRAKIRLQGSNTPALYQNIETTKHIIKSSAFDSVSHRKTQLQFPSKNPLKLRIWVRPTTGFEGLTANLVQP